MQYIIIDTFVIKSLIGSLLVLLNSGVFKLNMEKQLSISLRLDILFHGMDESQRWENVS